MSRMIDLIRSSAVPASLMRTAARGALALPAREMIEILVYLATRNPVFGQQARMTLAGWDEKSSREVAGDPASPKEVLNYFISAENLRPALLPLLLENPFVSEDRLVELAESGSREVVECFLKSPRAQQSSRVRQVLSANPNFTETNTTTSDKSWVKAPAAAEPSHGSVAVGPDVEATAAGDVHGVRGNADETPNPPAEDVLAPVAVESDDQADDVIDAEVMAYLKDHEAEIVAEGDKPFQPLGGIYESSSSDPAEPLEEVAEAVATTGGAAAAPKKAGVLKKTFLSADEQRGSALQKISKLDIKGRIQLAMKGTKEERSILVRDGTKLVALSVLDSPKITDGEVEKFANQKNVLEAVLRAIPMKRRFMKNYIVVRNLVANPRTPLDVSLGLMKNLLINDLRVLAGNKEVSETVRKLALKMFKQKSDPSKKSTG